MSWDDRAKTSMNNRPDWDQLHSEEAKLYASRGTCPRMKVGAVFVRDNRPICVGYNGAPKNQPHCLDVGCDLYWYGDKTKKTLVKTYDSTGSYSYDREIEEPERIYQRCQRAIHAEMNAIGYAAKYGIQLADSTLYLYPTWPCQSCELLLATVGIKELVVSSDGTKYPSGNPNLPILASIGVILRTVNGR